MAEEKLDGEKYSEEHRRRIMEGLKTGNHGGRPRKEINKKIVIARLNQDVPLTEIAAGQKMSVKTLKVRMREAKIKKEYGGENE